MAGNIYEPEFDMERDRPPYVWQRARIGRQVGSERLGASLFDVPPGAQTFPVHAHLHNEEMLIVVRGAPTLRDGEGGERVLAPGEVVAFPAGLRGAHGLRNDTGEVVRVLLVSTMVAPEVNVFTETGDLWIRDYVPGTDMPDGAFDVRAARLFESQGD